jgi:hypothetical protein
MIKQNSIGFAHFELRHTLVRPFETSLGTEWLLTIIPFLFSKFVCFASQSREYAGLNSVITKEAATNIFTSRFSLSEKLHLEALVFFNTTLFCR